MQIYQLQLYQGVIQNRQGQLRMNSEDKYSFKTQRGKFAPFELKGTRVSLQSSTTKV